MSTCTLKCSVTCYGNKVLAYAYLKTLHTDLAETKQLVKTLPLINNEEIVGTLQLCFNLQTFEDKSFDNDIKYLKQFGIQNKLSNSVNNKKFLHHSEVFKPQRNVKPIDSLSSHSSARTNKSIVELTTDYLSGRFFVVYVTNFLFVYLTNYYFDIV